MPIIAPPDLPLADLITAATANLATHFTWVQRQTAQMRVLDDGDFVLTDSGLPCDTFNAVCRAQFGQADAPQHIEELIAYFAGVERPFSWWVSPGDTPTNLGALLVAAGLEEAETELAMVTRLSNWRMPEHAPQHREIQRVQTLAHLQDFARVVAANWSPPDEYVLRFYDLAAPILLDSKAPLWLYVGYEGLQPVAAAELTLGGGIGGLYSVCTLEAYRGRGYGTAITLQPLLDAWRAGYHTAILQASDAGARIYTRLGFESFGHITEYKPR